MAERFYTPDRLGIGEFVLTGAEAHHLTTVRRFASGNHITLFNGDGADYRAEIVGHSKKTVTLNILSAHPADRELGFPLLVASALPKGDRADFLIEKLTELGVTQFIPLITARSVVIPKEAVVEKFTRAVVEASKQCGRNRLMSVGIPQKWDAFLHTSGVPVSRVVLHTAPGCPALPPLTSEGMAIAVGPEGGFTAEEMANAVAGGWQIASLGPRVLRVETAALAAVARVTAGSRSGQ